MATIGSTRGTNIPALDAAGSNFRITPESYTTIDNLIKATKDEVMPDLVETYGDQGITGFLKLTGAINAGGASDQIDWWEAGRRHKSFTYVVGDLTVGNTAQITIAASIFSFLTFNGGNNLTTFSAALMVNSLLSRSFLTNKFWSGVILIPINKPKPLTSLIISGNSDCSLISSS